MRHRGLCLMLLLLVACGGDRTPGTRDAAQVGHDAGGGQVHGEATVAYWTCPMHPAVRASEPGSCPICGMDLTPVTSEDLQSGAVTVSEDRRALAGIELAPAEMRSMRATVRAVGVVRWDQKRLADVTVKVDGYVREAWVQSTGEHVEKGQKLFSIYSPELLAAQEELLATVSREGGSDASVGELSRAARRRLRLLDLTEAQIAAIVKGGQAWEAIPVVSPATGTVIAEHVVVGAAVTKGMALYRIGDLGALWVEAQIPEQDAGVVRKSQDVRVSLPHLAGHRDGKVLAILPELDPMTRTVTVRIALDNADGALQPDQWASVEVDVDEGTRLAVPESAVIYTGPRRLVFVDAGGDRLVPREVKVGREADGWVAIEEGLDEGERVVIAGNFHVGADSRIQGGSAW